MVISTAYPGWTYRRPPGSCPLVVTSTACCPPVSLKYIQAILTGVRRGSQTQGPPVVISTAFPGWTYRRRPGSCQCLRSTSRPFLQVSVRTQGPPVVISTAFPGWTYRRPPGSCPPAVTSTAYCPPVSLKYIQAILTGVRRGSQTQGPPVVISTAFPGWTYRRPPGSCPPAVISTACCPPVSLKYIQAILTGVRADSRPTSGDLNSLSRLNLQASAW